MQAESVPGLTVSAPPPLRADWRGALGDHLLRLGPDSRLNRFLGWTSDDAIRRYAATANPALLVEARVNGKTCGVAELHVRKGSHPVAEIALSVEDDWQRRGVGAALFDRALSEARRSGVQEIWVFFLRTNLAMRKITGRAGFTRIADADPSVVRAHVGKPLVPGAEAAWQGPPGRPLN